MGDRVLFADLHVSHDKVVSFIPSSNNYHVTDFILSGHAIWIGNLPPQTDLMSLVHHVCREAPGLQSLFLISKSNCAFANYKDEPSCTSAQQKIHDSKFHSVRLVSRLRKSTVESASGATAPTGPASITPTPLSPSGESVESNVPSEMQANSSDAAAVSSSTGSGTPKHDKFFILKSLTIEDLELSVRTGVWATQAHNEESLNGAFKVGSHGIQDFEITLTNEPGR
jgi:hypothetical protein